MPKIRLNHRTIPTLTAGAWLTDYWDDTLPGFGVRVSQSGRMTFVVRFNGEGAKRRVTLGAFPALSLADAREQARQLLAAATRTEDPPPPKEAEPVVAEAPGPTFGELADVYIERHAKLKKRTWRDDERNLRVDLLPAWKDRPAKDIGRRNVAELLDRIVERGAPILANRIKALISKIFNFGIGRGLVETNPSLGVAMPSKERQRDRVLTEDEVRSLWRVLDAEGLVIAATFKMRLLTAQRGDEVLKMRWDQIRDGWWTIPGEVAKNGLSHRVPLASQAIDLLDQLRPTTGLSAWVFASPKKASSPITAIQKAAERIAKRSGVDFVPHDLRRTAASFMTSMGISRLVVSKILNHVESGITAVYDRHSYDTEKRQALEAWGQRLEAMLQARAA